MPGTPRTWTEDWPIPTPPISPEPTPAPAPTPTKADRVIGQIMQLVLEVLRDHKDLLDQFNAGLRPIRQEIRQGLCAT